jgi:hypothetical protein
VELLELNPAAWRKSSEWNFRPEKAERNETVSG